MSRQAALAKKLLRGPWEATGECGWYIAPDFAEIIAQRRHDLRDGWESEIRGRNILSGPNPFTQKALARRVGVSASTIGAWERGHVRQRMMCPRMFSQLGRALQLTPIEMLEAAGYMERTR